MAGESPQLVFAPTFESDSKSISSVSNNKHKTWCSELDDFQFEGSVNPSRDGHIDPARWCVAVGSPSPGRAAAAKGTGVHWLKGDASWVQNVVRQFGRYLQEVSVV